MSLSPAGGFLRIDHAVRSFAARLPGSAGWALLEILSRATMRDPRVSVGAIMEALGVGERTAHRALQDLHKLGVIVYTDSAATLSQGWSQVCHNGCTSVVTKLSKSERIQAVPHAKLESTKEVKKERSKEVSTSSLRSEVLSLEIPKKFDAAKLELPDRLSAMPGFAEIWLEWVAHRREKRQTLTPTAVKSQLAKLEKLPDPIEAVRYSLEGGYTGIYERPSQRQSATQSSTSPPQRNGVNDPDYWARDQQYADAKIAAILNGGIT